MAFLFDCLKVIFLAYIRPYPVLLKFISKNSFPGRLRLIDLNILIIGHAKIDDGQIVLGSLRLFSYPQYELLFHVIDECMRTVMRINTVM